MKYFVLGAFSSAFLLYGIALVYGATGSTNLTRIADVPRAATCSTEDGLLLAGFALLLVGLGFKVAAVPFHVWTPDVYQGAPTPVTAFMASASKAAGFAALLRVFVTTFGPTADDWRPVVFVPGRRSPCSSGSVLAIVQTDVKRMLAYSSISHAGFVLVGVQAASDRGVAGGALLPAGLHLHGRRHASAWSPWSARRGDADHSLDDYRGLAARRPGLALAFTVFLLAQAGRAVHLGLPGQVLRDRGRRRGRELRPGHRRHARRPSSRPSSTCASSWPCTCDARRPRSRPPGTPDRRAGLAPAQPRRGPGLHRRRRPPARPRRRLGRPRHPRDRSRPAHEAPGVSRHDCSSRSRSACGQGRSDVAEQEPAPGRRPHPPILVLTRTRSVRCRPCLSSSAPT